MSQPAKSVRVAPRDSCTSLSGVDLDMSRTSGQDRMPGSSPSVIGAGELHPACFRTFTFGEAACDLLSRGHLGCTVLCLERFAGRACSFRGPDRLPGHSPVRLFTVLWPA